KICLRLRSGLQALVGEAAEEICPDKVRLLRQAGIQPRLGGVPVLRLQVTDGEKEARPEMAGLHRQGTIELIPSLLPRAPAIMLLAGQKVVEHPLGSQGMTTFPRHLRLGLPTQELEQISTTRIIGLGFPPELAGTL